MKKLWDKLKEGKHWSKETDKKIILLFIYAISLTLYVGYIKRKLLAESDFGKRLVQFVTDLCLWWDKGSCFLKEDILSGAEVAISPVVGWVGVAILIVIAFIIIFKIKIDKPEK